MCVGLQILLNGVVCKMSAMGRSRLMGRTGRFSGERKCTYTNTPTPLDVWDVGSNVRAMAALASAHPYSGS